MRVVVTTRSSVSYKLAIKNKDNLMFHKCHAFYTYSIFSEKFKYNYICFLHFEFMTGHGTPIMNQQCLNYQIII